jgi:hypothetical protein
MAAVNQPTTEDHPPAKPEYEEPVEREYEAPVEAEQEEPSRESTLPPIVDPDGELEALEDRSMPVERVLWAIDRQGKRVEQVYVQKGLMWFGKIELYGILGQAVEVVLQGDNPLGIDSMLGLARNPVQMVSDLMGYNLPGADTAPDRQSDEEQMEVEAGKVMAAFAKVVALSPDLLKQAYCIALDVPKTHRNWAVEWAFPNIDDEMGKDVLHTFIDQNWGVMEDFFAHEVSKIIKRIVKARMKGSAGPR